MYIPPQEAWNWFMKHLTTDCIPGFYSSTKTRIISTTYQKPIITLLLNYRMFNIHFLKILQPYMHIFKNFKFCWSYLPLSKDPFISEFSRTFTHFISRLKKNFHNKIIYKLSDTSYDNLGRRGESQFRYII